MTAKNKQADRQKNAWPRRWDGVLIAVFTAMLVAPMLVLLLGPPKDANEVENRALAERPEWPSGIKTYKSFPQHFHAYWNDHFGLRAELTWLYSNALYHLLGTVPFGKVRIHPDGWVFEAIDDYRGCDSLLESPTEVDQIVGGAIETASKLKTRGVHYALMLVPNKGFIYRREAPGLACPPEKTTAHQVRVELERRGADFPVIDPYSDLVATRLERPLYYRTDAHWNDHGAFIGYQAMVRVLSKWFPQLSPADLADFDEQRRTHRGGALARMANLDLQEEEVVYLRRRSPSKARRIGSGDQETGPWDYERAPLRFEVNDPSLPRLLLFRDSYARQFKDWLPEHFRATTFLWQRGNADLLDTFPADVVVEERSY